MTDDITQEYSMVSKFSVGASSQWQEVCRWRRQWIDVVLVKCIRG